MCVFLYCSCCRNCIAYTHVVDGSVVSLRAGKVPYTWEH